MTILSKIIDRDRMLDIISEFSRLNDRCYLDNSGTALYPESLLQSVTNDLATNVYMNPHTDKYTRDCIEQIRCMVLEHFHTDPSTYTVIFTSGTTQSLKLVVESFQFACDQREVLNCGSFVYLRENHTSVLGLREIAQDKNADIIHLPHEEFLASLDSHTEKCNNNYKNEGNSLFVYPAQSNFNGYKYPIDCVSHIKDGALNHYIKRNLCKINCNWYVMLDAASYVSTSDLDLSKSQPDFVCFSFYKIFGYPTGLGALLVKNSSSGVLNQKSYFGGGTVDVVLSNEDYHVKRSNLHERFEDGTIAFLAIISLKHCFDVLYKLIPKCVNDHIMDTISLHTFYLAQDLYHQLKELRHTNGNKAAVLYMDTDFCDNSKQGSIVTFNITRKDDSYIGYAEFQHFADLFNINIRTGCFCNSGSCQRHLKANNKEVKEMYKAGHKCGDDMDFYKSKPTGAIRASFGYYNTYKDVDKLVHMIHQCFLKTQFIEPNRNAIQKPLNEVSFRTSSLFIEDIPLEQQKLYFHSAQSINSQKCTLQEISIFPIKSCGAFKINSGWKIGSKGFKFDREWMIVKDNGVSLTQKQNTQMCLIRPTIDLKLKVMVLNFKDKKPLLVPLNPRNGSLRDISVCHSKVCEDIINGIDCGDLAATWLSEALEIPFLRLIKQSYSDTRSLKKKTNEDGNVQLSLSNKAQFLLINKATVKWLHKKIDDPSFQDSVDDLTDRFRGNIIVDMDKELIEKKWQRVIIGKHEFKVEGECQRCQMVCIDQQTGEKAIEPLRTISEQFLGKLRFGIYLSYIGTIDGSKNHYLRTQSLVEPLDNIEETTRLNHPAMDLHLIAGETASNAGHYEILYPIKMLFNSLKTLIFYVFEAGSKIGSLNLF